MRTRAPLNGDTANEMTSTSDATKEDLCRNSSAGSTDRSLLTSSPDFLSPSHVRQYPPTSPPAKVRSKSLVPTPVARRPAEDDLHLESHRGQCRRKQYQVPSRLRRARSVSVLVGQNGQVWTQGGDDRCAVPTGHQTVSLAMDESVIATITQHYYPEGAWGWWVCFCSFMVHLLAGGLQGGYGLLLGCLRDHYGTSSTMTAGKFEFLAMPVPHKIHVVWLSLLNSSRGRVSSKVLHVDETDEIA